VPCSGEDPASCRIFIGVCSRSSRDTTSSIVAGVVIFTSRDVLLQLKRGGLAKSRGEGEKKKECTTECNSQKRRDEKALWTLNYESGEGGGDEKGRRRGDEKRAMYV
jgi:hypothetical protein